jgi:hypothetical protein
MEVWAGLGGLGHAASWSARNAPNPGGRVASASERIETPRATFGSVPQTGHEVSIRGSLREQLPFETASSLGLLRAPLNQRNGVSGLGNRHSSPHSGATRLGSSKRGRAGRAFQSRLLFVTSTLRTVSATRTRPSLQALRAEPAIRALVERKMSSKSILRAFCAPRTASPGSCVAPTA